MFQTCSRHVLDIDQNMFGKCFAKVSFSKANVHKKFTNADVKAANVEMKVAIVDLKIANVDLALVRMFGKIIPVSTPNRRFGHDGCPTPVLGSPVLASLVLVTHYWE